VCAAAGVATASAGPVWCRLQPLNRINAPTQPGVSTGIKHCANEPAAEFSSIAIVTPYDSVHLATGVDRAKSNVQPTLDASQC
jgi:hypothetical protein